jgi:hypothetical protein
MSEIAAEVGGFQATAAEIQVGVAEKAVAVGRVEAAVG